MSSLIVRSPDDWHCHLREGACLQVTAVAQAQQFSRSMVMPNLMTPITTVEMALEYRRAILAALPEASTFDPLMTLYLHPGLTVDELVKAHESTAIIAVKFYPRGATTLSDAGVVSWQDVKPQLQAMQELGLVLSIHGEVVDHDVDVFAREAAFLDGHLAPILQNFPGLKIVLEHVSSQAAVNFVRQAGAQLAATITPHHLLLNRNDLLVGGIKPHNYCLPILKKKDDQLALIEAAVSGDPHFFLGTDSAPHKKSAKQSACGCAGIYSACAAIEYYAEVFDRYSALDKLENFSSVFGAQFYGLPLNQGTIELKRDPWCVHEEIGFDGHSVVPLMAGKELQWKKV
jgi:dihydroorotase